MINSTTFGLRLRTLREQRGVSLNTVARFVGVSAGYLSNLESGKTEHISFTTLNGIYDVLKMGICPFCNQVVSESPENLNHADLALRVDLIHQVMTSMINSDPEFLKQIVNLLENGLYRNEFSGLQCTPRNFESHF
jgi:transcriptional regulator with XRE-family HTH domain